MSTNGHSNGASPAEWEWESDFRDHFFYFPEKSTAEQAAKRLLAKGWTVYVTFSAVTEDWLVQATDPAPSDEEFESQFRELESLAEELGGRYDGYGGPG